MKTLQFQQEFDCSLENLLRYWRDNYELPKQTAFPIRLLSERQEDELLHREREIDVSAYIPSAVRLFLDSNPDSSLILETSQFHKQSNLYSFTMNPKNKNKALFFIQGEVQYDAVDAGKSRRSYHLSIESGVPLLAGVIEAGLYDAYKKTAQKEYSFIVESIEEDTSQTAPSASPESI